MNARIAYPCPSYSHDIDFFCLENILFEQHSGIYETKTWDVVERWPERTPKKRLLSLLVLSAILTQLTNVIEIVIIDEHSEKHLSLFHLVAMQLSEQPPKT